MKKIKTALPPKRIENELLKFSRQLNKDIHRSFINQVAKQLQVSTINKFTDAQRGNYANVIKKLTKEFIKKFGKRYSQRRIKKFIKSLYIKASKYNQTILSTEIEKEMGIKLDDIVKKNNFESFIESKAIETAMYYDKFITETGATLQTSLLRYAGKGMAIEEIVNTLQKEAKKGNKRAEFIARNEVKNLNSQLTKKRGESIGVTHAIWRGSLDERERDCHKVREGEKFILKDGCFHSCDGLYLQPGEDFNCRCTYELDVSDILRKDNNEN